MGRGDAFQKAKGEALPYPDAAAVEANSFASRRAAIGLVLMLTAPGIPMILQGQELYDCKPYKWPRGPALDWSRTAAAEAGGAASKWTKLFCTLVRLRQRCSGAD